MYQSRLLTTILKQALKRFPAVLVTGPRQAGKTTFLLHELGETAEYVSFDDPLERNFAHADPNGFLDRFGDRPVILDEVQYVPEILPYLKMRIDRTRPRSARWILTGSQQFQLMKNVTESLAGRIAVLELLPFSRLERKKTVALEKTLWNGGYPDPMLHPEKRELWVRSYVQTYIERDVRQLQSIKDLRTFELFIGLAAAAHGQTLNTATLSRQTGVSLPTVKSWAGILEASYLCYFLPPYFRNYGKRLVKTPKLYFIDSALVCSMTRQPDAKAALSGAAAGALFEGLVVSEAVKAFTMLGRKPDLFFWRSHDGLEVDLIIQAGGKLHPVEIKMTATPTLKHLEPLHKFRALAEKDTGKEGILVCRVPRTIQMSSNDYALPWDEFPKWLWKKLREK